MSDKENLKPRTKKVGKKNLEFEISFFESLLKDDPDLLEAAFPLAEDYTQAGRFEDGLKLDLKLSAAFPEDPVVRYNLSCSYSLLKQIPQAAETLKKAIELGYIDFEYIEKDPDLSNLRSTEAFREIEKKFFHSQKNNENQH